ncbi:MAG TPA: Ku protein [Acidimicrobiales bacterium]|nr:Ku protein [Acidimicrobiales bacterium]
MARTIWKGSLSFGLVNVPVGLYPATKDKTIHFNQFEEGTSDRIRYKKINERTGDEVESSRIVKGADVGGGDFVILSPEELASAEPERSRTIEITDFVELEDIDPTYYRTTYYLAPEGEAAAKAYALLRRAMRDAHKVGVATFVMRNKEYLVAIRPDRDVLALETMYFADEVLSPADELPRISEEEDFTKRELEMADLLIDSMVTDWDPSNYADTHREKVQSMIDRKREGEEVVTEMAPREPTKVIDLMDALNASVKAASGGRAGASRSRASSTRSKPAADEKKATASKKVTPVKRAAKAKKQPVAATRSRRKAS